MSEQGQDVNFSIDAGAADGDSFTQMVYTSGSLYYIKESGVQYNVFSYADYVINHIGWKYDGITGEPSKVYFGEEPQEVSKQWLDWFLSIATEEVEETIDELAGTWIFKTSPNLASSKSWLLDFVSNGRNCIRLSISSLGYIYYMFEGESSNTTVYANTGVITSGWNYSNSAYKTITITSKLSEVTDGTTLLTWLKANATKQ